MRNSREVAGSALRSFGALALVASALSWAVVGTPAPSPAAGPPVTGTVFRDFDADGTRDPLEPGEAGVRVTIISTDGFGLTVTSGPDGRWSTDADIPLAGTRFRVTFSDWPAYLQPSAHGAGNGTDVQFVDAGGTADFAVTNPAQFCSSTAELATTCFQGGTAAANGPAVVAFPQDSGTASTTSNDGVASSSRGEGMASHADLAFDDVVGPVRGLAWQRSTQTIFAAAYAKRHTAYPSGPNDAGPDRIWSVPRGGGAPSVFFAADAGDDEHDYANLVADAGFWDQVGRSGWGDIDMSEDESVLYAANMGDRLIYEIPVTGTPPVAGPATTVDVSPRASVDCGGDDWVPGGIKARDGLVYVTVTCTAASLQQVGDLRGVVYAYEPKEGTLDQVADFPLNYARGAVSEGQGIAAPATWRPWTDTERTQPPGSPEAPFGQVYYPQPWLTDVEFDEGGRMLIGVTDRVGDQFGNDNGAGPAGNNEGVSAGDTLILPAGAGGTWGAPVGGDVLAGERYPLAGVASHSEVSLGHLAVRLGSGSVISNAYDPAPVPGAVRTTDGGTVLFPESFRSGGLISMDTATGARTRSYQLFGIDEPGTFGKAAGVGDIELLCDAAPLEIGDLVWVDTDGDGQQDADELPVPGVTVRLYDAAGNVAATTTTDATGRWYFPVAPNTAYTVRMDNPADYRAGGPLQGLVLTGADRGGDVTDSDATTVAGFPRIPVTTGGPGANDHDFDAGFSQPYSLGNQVWIDTDADGRIDPGERPVPGVTVALLDAAGNPVLGPEGRPLTTTTDAAGLYLFPGLPPGEYVVSIPASNFAPGGPLAGLESTPATSADPDDDVDNDDNGAPGPAGSVRSGPIILGPGEPTGETPDNDGSSAPDNHSNLTVDFGFVRAGHSLGNQVWIDTDRDGRIDAGERLVPGVVVALLDGQGTPVLGADGRPRTTTTDSSGLYLFTGLLAGDYIVSIAAANFADGGPLDGYLSTPPTSADPDDDVDGDDNGTPRGDGSVRTGVVTLGPGEPTGESPDNDPTTPDSRENLTVDFGFVQRTADLAIEKRVISDLVAGATGTYEVTVTNRGPDSTASQVVVEDRERAGLDLLDAQGAGWACRVADDTATCRYDDILMNGDTASFRVRATVTARPGTELANGATVRLVDNTPTQTSGDQPDTTDPAEPNDEDVVSATVDGAVEDTDGGDDGGDGGDAGGGTGGGTIPDTGSPVAVWQVAASLIALSGGTLLVWRSRRRTV